MSEPLKYKAEKAISAFLAATPEGLSGYSHYQGQNPGAQAPPCVVVYVTSMRESFAESQPKDVSFTVEVVTHIDSDRDTDSIAGEATDRAANWLLHRTATASVEERLADLVTIQSFANKVNEVNRPVEDFYVYDIQAEGQGSTMAGEDRVLISTFSGVLVCEANDN